MGLGNPGPRYERTRHNVGFMVLDALCDELGLCWSSGRACDRTTWRSGEREIVLIKPQTYMNRSGQALMPWIHADPALTAAEVLVAYDDADLELGRLRLRPSGGSGGHNGLRSLTAALGAASFGRVRVGVRGEDRDRHELADYVLAPFDDDERELCARAVAAAAAATRMVIEQGLVPAMNRYNGMTMERDVAGEGPSRREDSNV